MDPDDDEGSSAAKTRRHYSKDLRERIVYQHFQLEKKTSEISRDLDIPLRVVQRTLQLWNEIGSVVKDPQGCEKRGRPMLLNEMACNYMMHLLETNPDLYLDEIAFELTETLGLAPALSTIHRTLELLGYSTKKLSKSALERCEKTRQDFLFSVGQETPERLVFVDESAVNVLTTYRTMGRALKGERARKTSYFQRGARFSVLPALAMEGIIYLHVVQGSFDGTTFLEFITGLMPHMNPYPAPKSVLVMDNCAIHHVDGVANLCMERGVKLLYLPPYSPDFNPIEECFSYMKSVLRRNGDGFRDVLAKKDPVLAAGYLSDVLTTVTPEHTQGWFKHSNYL